MASNLACIGLTVDDADGIVDLTGRVLPDAETLGTVGDVRVFRWQDPSGARLVLGLENGQLVDFLPSFAGAPGVRFGGITARNDEVAHAAVVDADGEQLTAMTFELEQHRALTPDAASIPVHASVVAFATDVTVHTDAEAFAASPASLLDPDADLDTPPPPHVVERGLTWPIRMSAESFIPLGAFLGTDAGTARARLNGVVLVSERRTNTLSGLPFVVARVSCFGFEVDVLLEGSVAVPPPGAVVAGTVFLVASADAIAFPAAALDLAPEPRRRSLFRRRNQ